MTELELALMDAKQVWLNAGDADGNAEAARFALEQRANIPRAIEALTLAKEQAERTAMLAARTLARLRAMTPNADVTGLPPAQTVELPPNPAGGRSELT